MREEEIFDGEKIEIFWLYLQKIELLNFIIIFYF
jgi:hypothetical protein